MPRPEFALKDRLRLAGLTLSEIADRLDRPAWAVRDWLDGFQPLPDSDRERIEKILRDRGREARSIAKVAG